MRLRFVTTALCLATSLAAQQRPSFAGEWVATDDRAATVAATGDAAFRRGDMGSGWGSTLTIAQTTDSVIVSYVFFGTYDLQPPIRLAFALAGESTQSLMVGHATSELRSRISWRDSSLVITSAYALPRGIESRTPAEVTRTLTLTSPTSLVVETARAGSATPIRTVYTKK